MARATSAMRFFRWVRPLVLRQMCGPAPPGTPAARRPPGRCDLPVPRRVARVLRLDQAREGDGRLVSTLTFSRLLRVIVERSVVEEAATARQLTDLGKVKRQQRRSVRGTTLFACGVLIGHVVCPFLSKKFGRCDILYTLSDRLPFNSKSCIYPIYPIYPVYPI